MRAHEIMVREIVAVHPETQVSEIAELFVKHRISCVPVVTPDKRVLGLVTASDLIHRRETSTERRRKWWLDLFADADARARDFIKEHGLKARDVMATRVVSVAEDAELATVAETLDKHNVRRVPVLRDGKLVGIVSRSDLVKALARASQRKPEGAVDNETLHQAIRRAIDANAWLTTTYMSFSVNDGMVELSGFVDSEAQQKAIRVLIEEVPGVRAVKDGTRVHRFTSAA